jgi:hypothetical protein
MSRLKMALLFGLISVSVQAQEPDAFAPAHRVVGDSASAHQPGPMRSWTTNRKEMAREYIRVRAQEKAEARTARIEGMRALGFSPQRPTVNATPFTSHPPTWAVSSHWGYPFGNSIWYHSWYAAPNMFP